MSHTSSTSLPLYPSSKIIWATLLACCLQATLMIAAVAADDTNSKPADDENLQVDNMSKRDWNQKLQMWGKRGWSNLHGGWGLKRSVPTTWNDVPIVEKRAWDSFQGGWGKRFAPYDDEARIQELASLLDEDDNRNVAVNPDSYDFHDDEKRNWNKFNGGWGKRSKWENFRGAWGKRDPAWSNLKGYWGKRSVDQY